MILVFPKETYITILPALYSLKLDHFSQVSSHRLALSSTPCSAPTSMPHLTPSSRPRPILSFLPHLTLLSTPGLAQLSTACHESSTRLVHLNQPSIPSPRLEK